MLASERVLLLCVFPLRPCTVGQAALLGAFEQVYAVDGTQLFPGLVYPSEKSAST